MFIDIIDYILFTIRSIKIYFYIQNIIKISAPLITFCQT